MYPNLNKTLLFSKYCIPAGVETAVADCAMTAQVSDLRQD